MPKKDHTAIVLVLDKSGSMEVIRDDTIGAVNAFMKDQQEVAGTANLWLYLFDSAGSGLARWHRNDPLNAYEPLTRSTYAPSGATALLDAVCNTIDEVGSDLANMAERDRPEKVVFVVQTDGHENDSRKFKIADARDRITRQQNEWNWQFLFLGADQDAWDAGMAMGIAYANTISYTNQQVGESFSMTSHAVRDYREGTVANTAYADNDIRAHKPTTAGSGSTTTTPAKK